MPREAPERPADELNKPLRPRVLANRLAIIPATDWVTERTQDGTRTVLPLVAWLVTAEGELKPLPLSLGDEWIVRPRTADDDRLLKNSGSRLRPHTEQKAFYR
jgi:hypothetical protein